MSKSYYGSWTPGYTVKQYRVKLRHDRGVRTVSTAATSAKNAVHQVLLAEHAPRSAVVAVGRGRSKMRSIGTRHRRTR